jgi:signal transduction histidine kinase
VIRLRSLRAIALTFIGAISVATLATGAAVYLALVGTIDHEVDKRLERERTELLAGSPSQAILAARIVEETRRRDSGDIGFLLRDRDGRVVFSNMSPHNPMPEGYSTLDHENGIPGFTRGRALVQSLPHGGVLMLAAESEPVENHDAHRLLILTIGFGGIVLLVIAGTIVLGVSIRRNIEKVRTAAESIVDGDMQARVPVEGAGTAFGAQATAFNHMLDRIGELMTSLSDISNDVAHDMRTPLARLHGHLRRIAADPAAAPVKGSVDDAVAQSEDLLAMFAAILRITEIEGGERRAMFARIDLSALARDVCESLDAMVEDGGRSLKLGALPPLSIDGDVRLLTQLLVNLVENAVNHTPPGTVIHLSLRQVANEAVLTIADNGPGIAAEDRAVALRRFGRIDKSRARPGHGLGLPLVLAIARLHRGGIELEDAAPGLAVRVHLPLP